MVRNSLSSGYTFTQNTFHSIETLSVLLSRRNSLDDGFVDGSNNGELEQENDGKFKECAL